VLSHAWRIGKELVGLAGLASTTPPFQLKPKILPNAAQDSGEILKVDTTQLPAKTESVSVPINAG